MKVLVTGATGYIGGRLVPRLLQRGCTVRILVRDTSRVTGRGWSDQVEVVRGDLLDPGSLEGVFDGIDVAYYLVHSMYAGKDFDQRDRRAAKNFCCFGAALRHVVYLGGLQPKITSGGTRRGSRHLHSRAEIGRILSKHLPTTEFRAGPIIGSGSASFEMLRYLTERFPIIVVPIWMRNTVQPIAIRDVLSYLIDALDHEASGVVEIGSERLTFAQMMREYARARALRRLVVPVLPLGPSWIGAGLTGMVTPIPGALALPLIESMRRPLHADLERAKKIFPAVEPMAYGTALVLALQRIEEHAVETHWSGAPATAPDYEYRDSEGLIREVRTLHLNAEPEAVFRVFSGLGGDRGWLTWNWAWRVRGILDRIVGGPGLRRGRRDPDELLPWDTVDFWRVEKVACPRLLRLRAEAKVPGQAWLQWETTPEAGGTRLIQTAAFAPRGLAGALYWYSLYPFHKLIFTDLIRAIGRTATQRDSERPIRNTLR